MPDAAALGAVRNAIVAWPERWQEIRQVLPVHGESLKRPPRGYDPNHPLIDDIKRKSFVWSRHFTPVQACSPGFEEHFLGACRDMTPFLAFLCQALDLPF